MSACPELPIHQPGPHAIRLSTGRIIDPNGGVLGLMPDYFGFGRVQLTEGYDNLSHHDPHPEFEDPDYAKVVALTPAERRELAEIMVARWQAWGNVQISSSGSGWPLGL